MLYSQFRKKMTPYLYEQEKKASCLCARRRREGERWDASPEKMDCLEMSHPAVCPCLAERNQLSPGVGTQQGSARA